MNLLPIISVNESCFIYSITSSSIIF